jgi:hypothetical protein
MALTSEDFGYLSAIWILASNDDNPLITYEGIRYRLNLPNDYDVQKLIRARAELFRHGVPQAVLDAWKDRLRAGESTLPSWIRAKPKEEWGTLIDGLKVDHVFRSQFRTAPGSARSEIAIITWGLEHLDRLRKSHLEASESTATTRQMWLLLAVGMLNFVATIVAAIIKGKS